MDAPVPAAPPEVTPGAPAGAPAPALRALTSDLVHDLRRRGIMHGLGIGSPADPANESLVMPVRPDELRRLQEAVSLAARDCAGMFVLPLGWLHTTLETVWDPAPDHHWTPPAAELGPARAGRTHLRLTEYSLQLVIDDAEPLRRVAVAYGVDPVQAAGTTFAITLAYSARDIDSASVSRFLTRLARHLGQRGPLPEWSAGLTFDRVEARLIRPDEPLTWTARERWCLARGRAPVPDEIDGVDIRPVINRPATLRRVRLPWRRERTPAPPRLVAVPPPSRGDEGLGR